jgi:hypothetical protein
MNPLRGLPSAPLVVVLSSYPSGLEPVLLMGCLMGPKSFLEGL